MITFLELGSLGRLGNQMFQYAALKSLALENGYTVKLPEDIHQKSWHGQICLLDNFNLEYEYLTGNDNIQVTYNQNQITGSSQKFDENFYNLSDGTNLYGFFQNVKYFDRHEDQIKKEFSFHPQIYDQCGLYLRDVVGLDKPIVSVHLRRPDNNNIVLNDYSISYYMRNALKFFEGDFNFLFFAGGATTDGNSNLHEIDYLRDTYKGDNFYHSDTNDTIMDLCLMSMCDHNIVAQDSTYSWWAAYLNSNPDKIVVAPERLHTSIIDTNDSSNIPTIYDNYYPDDWILVG